MLLERTPIAPGLLDLASHLVLEQTVYREARLLDEERFDEWLDLTTDDIRYTMLLGSRRFRRDRSPLPVAGRGFIFDDDRNRLRLRIDRLQSGYVWAEDPMNCVRRLVSNVEIVAGEAPGTATVCSNVAIHRNRIDGETRLLVAGRRDEWREVEGNWRLARREMTFDHSTVPDSNLNVFF
jgi:3-phenylpropionate/trans-cinnamate dioxygenase beta subunit